MFFEGKDDKPEVVVTKPDEVKTYRGTDVVPSETVTKKPKRRLGLFLSLLVLLVGLAFLAGFMLRDSASNKAAAPGTHEQTPKTNQTTPQKTDYAKEVFDTTTKAIAATPVNSDLGKYLPFIHVDGYEYSVVPKPDYAANYQGSLATVKQLYATAKTSLTSQSMTATEEPDTAYSQGTNLPYLNFSNQNVSCGLSTLETNQPGNYLLSLACANQTSYVGLVKKLQPFWNLYVAGETNTTPPKDGSMGLRDFVVTPSSTTGYAHTTISIGGAHGGGGFAALFYQTPDKKWHFFKGTQSQLNCSDYNTLELRKAYLGETCYDAATSDPNSKVTLQ